MAKLSPEYEAVTVRFLLVEYGVLEKAAARNGMAIGEFIRAAMWGRIVWHWPEPEAINA